VSEATTGNPPTANKLTADLLIAIPQRFPHLRVWRNNRLNAMVTGREGKMRRVNAGVDGQGDISGVAGVSIGTVLAGVRIEIEVKAGRDKQSDKQKAFEHLMRSHGAVYLICRDVEQCLTELGAALEGYTL
jgi:hypothetical protein